MLKMLRNLQDLIRLQPGDLFLYLNQRSLELTPLFSG